MRFHKFEEWLRRAWTPPLVERLRAAEKFYVGDVGQLPAKGLEIGDFPRLPYRDCAFEFEMAYPAGTPKTFVCMARERAAVELGVPEKHGDVTLSQFVVFCRDAPEREHWRMFANFTLVVSPIRTSLALDTFGTKARQNGCDALRFDYQTTALACPDGAGTGVAAPDKYGEKVCAFFIGSFLRILNCVNVHIASVEAPSALNKKRERSGKPPIYSYKTLVLRPSAALRTDKGGTHESPRIHLRRGHIKHRKTGDFWWQPCVVGDRTRGVVMKDYRADKLLEPTPPARAAGPASR